MTKPELVFSPSDLAASINQTFEFAYGLLQVEGEISNFKISKNRWVYFDIKDEQASIRCFGTVYQLPGPLEDGMMVHIGASPRLHPQFGFSLHVATISPFGEGSLKRASELLVRKLTAEGLFAEERKRLLPTLPDRIGLVTSAESAAYSDFMKVISERWRGLHILLADVQVQGASAPSQLVEAVSYLNELPEPPDVIVITRGGGSADDLGAFDDERVVRAIAASRVPTMVAIGHEIDVSLAELAADKRASTPSNAAQLLVPDRQHVLERLASHKQELIDRIVQQVEATRQDYHFSLDTLNAALERRWEQQRQEHETALQILTFLDPRAALRRGYAAVRGMDGRLIRSTRQVVSGDSLTIDVADGTIPAIVRSN